MPAVKTWPTPWVLAYSCELQMPHWRHGAHMLFRRQKGARMSRRPSSHGRSTSPHRVGMEGVSCGYVEIFHVLHKPLEGRCGDFGFIRPVSSFCESLVAMEKSDSEWVTVAASHLPCLRAALGLVTGCSREFLPMRLARLLLPPRPQSDQDPRLPHGHRKPRCRIRPLAQPRLSSEQTNSRNSSPEPLAARISKCPKS